MSGDTGRWDETGRLLASVEDLIGKCHVTRHSGLLLRELTP